MSESKQLPSIPTLLQRVKHAVAPLQTLATTVTVTSVMTGIVPLTQTTLTAGGPVVMVFGFLFVCLMTSTIALSLADIASGFPYVKGGLIEYSRRLAPPRLRRISSWLVGWLHFAAFVTGSSSCAFAFAFFSTAAIQIATGHVPQRWITVLIHIVISILFGAINAYNVNIDMISAPPSATWVFTHFENQTGWSSSLYVTLIGLSQGAFTMTGYDAPIHTMYNVKNAAWKVPQGIFIGFLVSFTMGTILILTLLYGIDDLNAIINPTISGVSAIEIFSHLIGHFGTTCITIIFIGTFFFCGQGVLKACSQVGQELAASEAFPKSEYLAKALTSAVAIELNLVYSVPIALRLFYPNPTLFRSGPFSLGPLRRPIAFVAITWAVLGVFVFSLPGIHPITTDNMNYASVLLLSTVGLILGYWFFSARYWFGLDSGCGRSGAVYMLEKAPTTVCSVGGGRGVVTGARGGAGDGLCGISRPDGANLEGGVDCDDKDLDEIGHWLDHLERDLRSLD
ncbi:hypothetical protein BG015_004016 [Linnemannia schmuckeri]|uniref:Amino acid transporter n=1 Tax=Linnemannia schmuckeri TaxID=64567 RepID=A0A9P5RGX6_9FUNG|nr:hypothetical protein BG015_004016 [Linnemannia schmuckeri]